MRAPSALRALAHGAAVALAAALLAGACAQPSQVSGVLQAADLTPPSGLPFDPTQILSDGAFTDYQHFTVDNLQAFFRKTPYGRGTFLETYASNGFRASDAILRTASRYHVNPLVLLAWLEVDGGLVGDVAYPVSSPRLVEYVFACGCVARGQCDPAYGGLDRQLDCLGSTLRSTFDGLSAHGATAGGWAVGQPHATLDGKTVAPASAATAALYDFLPVVGTGSGGNWVFWSVFSNYAVALSYVPPLEVEGGQGSVGDACKADGDCGFAGALCDTTAPGGACTADCSQAPCPVTTGRPAAFCGVLNSASRCLLPCQPDVAASCRGGYECRSADAAGVGADGGDASPPEGGAPAQFVCLPPSK